MNKKSLIFTAALIIVIAASMAFVLIKKDSSPTQTIQAPTVSETPSPSEQPPASTPIKGTYVSYTTEAFAATPGTRILFFHAPWCPQCRMLDDSIKAAIIPDNTTIFKIDYDTNQALRAKYGVTLQTTFVKVDSSGNKIASFTAYEEPNFQSVKQALLP